MHDDLAETGRRVAFLTELAILGGAAVFAYLVYRACAYRFLLSLPLAALCGVAGLVIASFVLTRLRDARGFNANAVAILIAMIAVAGAIGLYLWHHWPMLLDNLGLLAASAVVLAGAIAVLARLRARST